MQPVLVTGAAGGIQGSTGRHLTAQLLGRGIPVRALVHTDDERAAPLRRLGAEVIVGDLREYTTNRTALDGVRAAYFTYPVIDGLLDAAGAFAVAAHDAGLGRVVAVSQLAAGPQALTPRMRQHWVAEQILDWADIGAIHLRAAVFHENLALLADTGDGTRLTLPLGPETTVLPLVAATDVARVAAGLLTDPTRPADPVLLLTGDIQPIGAAARTLGRTYTDTPPERWHRWALDFYRSPHAAEHLTKLWEIFRLLGEGTNLYQITPTIERYGGHPPTTLAAFAAHRHG
ncbi:NAD(P)H-binding protein [Nocardia sp. CDC159]|uniref:NAD(P)H-binding protein n=1 Tax=Nocardia pulmonis TaxID=2951408 RepID=A0A9X2E6C7_9NOCA|nr:MULTISPECIES: NAD(P)H-binding protein [Nocardia]MCM6772441.1 NAD(P)H-binding protein [Nocardia pulmonis]MCM6784901.1 NAD(P)H-binding protein [Nocardia sp. CDC159]